jgi:hypothetical protein
MGGNMNMPPQGFPGRVGAMEFRPGMIPPHPMHMQHMQQRQQHQQHHHQQQAMMRMGGPGAMSSWMQQGPGRIHRVPAAHSIDDGSSVASKPMQQHEREVTPQSLPEKDPSSFDSQHDVAQSVLLLAAGSPRKVKSTDDDDDEESTTERVPLKKRKMMTGILRHQAAKSAPCSVSPMSHGSKTLSSGESTTRTPSYDLKDGIVLPDSAKISNTKDIDIAPPAHVVIPHFPSVLHSLLTESEYAGTVVQWLPHGQAWKIVRWDTLRRQALPKYFPQLVEENGGKHPSGSIDAFLWHTSAWGFEEVTHGPDMGAYANVVSICIDSISLCPVCSLSYSHGSLPFFHTQLFRRDIPTLCREMHFAPASEKDDDTIDSPVATKNSGGARSILQVPSLGSVGGTESHGGRPQERRSQQPDVAQLGYRSAPVFGSRPNPMNWTQDGRQQHHYQQQQQQQQYHQQQQNHQQHQQQQQEAFWMANQGGAMRQHPDTHVKRPMPPMTYSLVSIRSGRGAARLPAPRRPEATPSASASASASAPTSASRPSYPVSNRGKGSRHKGSRRVSSPKGSEAVANANVSGAIAQAFTKTIVSAVVTPNTSAVLVDKGVKQVAHQVQPLSILKRKLSSVDSSKPAIEAMEEKKDDVDDDNIVSV